MKYHEIANKYKHVVGKKQEDLKTSKSLSEGQLALWLLEQANPGNHTYNITFSARVLGTLNTSALEKAFVKLIKRHQSLRMTFIENNGTLKSIIRDDLPIHFATFDVQNMSEKEVHSKTLAFHRNPFDLTNGLPVRIGLFKLDIKEHILLFNMHHIVGDFQSMEIAYMDLEAFYLLELNNEEKKDWLKPIPNFSEFIETESEYISSGKSKAACLYWRRQLQNPPAPIKWRTRISPAQNNESVFFFSLQKHPAQSWRQLTRETKATIYTIFLAAWAEVLARYTGERDCIIGVPVSTRKRSFSKTIGYFINTLPIRLKVDSNKSFRQLVSETKTLVMEGLEHKDFQFQRIVDSVGVSRYPGRNPLYQTLIAFQHPVHFTNWEDIYISEGDDPARVQWAGLSLAPWRLEQQESQVDLALEVIESKGLFKCALRCARKEISPDLSEFANQLAQFLENAVKLPDQPLQEIQFIGDKELELITNNMNSHILLQLSHDDYIKRFLLTARRLENSQAVTDGYSSLTYSELDSRSLQIATFLWNAGVNLGDRVAVSFPPSTNAVLCMLAVMRTGASYVPIDPRMPAERLNRIMKQGQIRIALVSDNNPIEFPEFVRKIFLNAISNHDIDSDLSLPGYETVAYTIFTSGSTGEPKGIDVSHGSMVVMLDATIEVLHVDHNEVWMWFHAASFDFSVWEIWGALISGAKLIIASEETRSKPDKLIDLILREQVTILGQTPSALKMLENELSQRPDIEVSLKHIVIAGESLPSQTVRQIFHKPLTMWNFYGVSEATVFTTFEKISKESLMFDIVPIGQPFPHGTVHILDERKRPVPQGILGELWIGGPGVSVGYVNLPELNAQNFVPDFFTGGTARLYRTGDYAIWDGKRIHFYGRGDNQVKIRGYRIELDEIKIAYKTSELVSDIAVVVEHAKHGDQLVGIIVPTNMDAPPSEVELRNYGAQLIQSFMIPTRFIFVPQLPVNSHHKLDFKAIRRLLDSPNLQQQTIDHHNYVGTCESLQRDIRYIWERVLKRTKIGLDDLFFEVGGNSLAILSVLDELKKLPSVNNISHTDLYRFPTIRSLTHYIQKSTENRNREESTMLHCCVVKNASNKLSNGIAQNSEQPTLKDHRVAVIGYNFRFPGASNADEFWQNLCEGKVSIRRYDSDALRKIGVDPSLLNYPDYVPADATLGDIDQFDPEFFGYSNREAALIDPQQRLFLECAWELLEKIGYGNPQDRPTIGIFAGSSMNTYLQNVLKQELDLSSLNGTEILLTNDKDYLASRVSYKLGLTGPSIVVQTGCSTSLVAAHMAIQSILSGECDIAFAGGVSVHVHQRPGYIYEPDLMFSPDGICRAFDKDAAGTPFGDGVGLVAFQKLESAMSNGNLIKAVVRASNTNNDGSEKVGYTAPSVNGQRSLIEQAQTAAGVKPTEIGFIEAHGTATPMGDPIEFTALTEAFRSKTKEKEFCALGSVKTNIGHLAAAAGVAGLVKVLLAIEKAQIPPHPTFKKPHSELNIDKSPFFVNTKLIPWPIPGPRIAGVSSFGVGGSNAHLILEEPPIKQKKLNSSNWQLIPISARTKDALEILSTQLMSNLRENEDCYAVDVAFTLQVGRQHDCVRRVVYGREINEIISNLQHKKTYSEVQTTKKEQRLVFFIGETITTEWFSEPLILLEVENALFTLNDKFQMKLTKEDVFRLYEDSTETEKSKLAQFTVMVSVLSFWLRLVDVQTFIIANGFGNIVTACALGMVDFADVVNFLLTQSPQIEIESSLSSNKYFWSLTKGKITTMNLVNLFNEDNLGSNEPNPIPISNSDIILSFGKLNKLPERLKSILLDVGPHTLSFPESQKMSKNNGPSWLLLAIGELWSQGISFNWQNIHHGEVPNRIPLPSQPLNKKRCWWDTMEKSPKTSSFTSNTNQCINNPQKWLYIETWKRAGLIVPKNVEEITGPVVIFKNNKGLCAAISTIIRNLGTQVISIHRSEKTCRTQSGYCLNSSEPGAGEILGEMFQEDGLHPNRIIHAWGIDQDSKISVSEYLDQGLYVLIELAKKLQYNPKQKTLIDVLTVNTFNVSGNDFIDAAQCLVLGAIRVIPQEIPWLRARCIDVGPQIGFSVDEHASQVLNEILLPLTEPIVALRYGYRWLQKFEQNMNSYSPAIISKGGVCLVTGGLGNMGLALAEQFAHKYNTKLLLVSRRGTPPREEWESIVELQGTNSRLGTLIHRLLEIERSGISILVVAADVTQKKQMAEVITNAEARLGPITTFIHAAGLPGHEISQRIKKTSRNDWEQLLEPKIRGVQILHELLSGPKLEFGYFVSSLASITGGFGYASYTAANNYLDGFAQQHRNKIPYLSVNWEGWKNWEGNEAKKGIRTVSDKRLSIALSPRDALEVNNYATGFINDSRVVVSRLPIGNRIQLLKHIHSSDTELEYKSSSKEDQMSIKMNETNMKNLWEQVLKCTVDSEINFFDLGGDSLIGAKLINTVNEVFRSSLVLTDLFEAPTVKQLFNLLSHSNREKQNQYRSEKRINRRINRK